MKKLKLKLQKKNNSKSTTKKISIGKLILSIGLIIAIFLISIFLIFILYIVITSPDFEKEALYQKEPTILYDINGDEITRIGTKDSTIVTYDELPEVLIDALIATEDSRFFQHNGIDLVRFFKASFLQLLGQSDAGGASTLSMQVVKNTYTQKGELESNMVESLIRKFKDIYLSVFKLEANYTKEEIIEFYLNSQWFANTGNIYVSGLWGIERASEWYFGKSAKDLNLAEASLMAGMFQNTSWYNPYKNPEGCRNRQKTVLTLMVKHGYITEEQKEAVLAIPISSMFISHENDDVADSYQAFVDFTLNQVEEKFGIDPSETSLQIYTTFDPAIQSTLEKVEKGEVYEFPNEVVEEGIAVTDTKTGALVAISGGRKYVAKGSNYAISRRQPGSTAKPIVDYAMYIEHISQSTYAMFLDEPTSYSNGSSISNYDNKYRGLITMRYALDDSRNIPALLAFKSVAKIDLNILKDFVKSVGIDYGSDLYESASIGGFDNGVTPVELSAAYATFARGGYYIEPYSFTKIINNETGQEETYSYTKVQVMEESTAYMITDILIDAYGGSTGKASQVAGKTGTTNLDKDTKKKYKLPSGALKDAWLVSYSSSYSIALWYGYDKIEDNASEMKYYLNSETGGTARRKIMNYLANNIYKKGDAFKRPGSITYANIETETFPAQLCSEFTPDAMCLKNEMFVSGTEPTEVSDRFSKLKNPTNGSYTFNGSSITLKWEPIATPKAIDNNYLVEHFTEYYGDYADKYYQNRIDYNNSAIGSIGYEIYLKNNSGLDVYLGYTTSPTFTYNTSSGDYTFIIKSAYSIFKDNRSDGLEIVTQANIQSPIEDIIGGNTNNNDNNNNDNNNNDITNDNENIDTGLN